MRFASGEEAASLLAADSGVIPDYGVGSGAHRGGTTGAAWVRRAGCAVAALGVAALGLRQSGGGGGGGGLGSSAVAFAARSRLPPPTSSTGAR